MSCLKTQSIAKITDRLREANEWVRSVGGMMLTEESGSTDWKTRPNATLLTTNRTWTDQGLKPSHHGQRPATKMLSYGTA